MVRLFRREPRTTEVEPITVRVTGLSTMTHVIEKRQDPKPVRGYLVWTNQNGQRWQSQPFLISGQASMPIDVPLSFLTGRDKDISKLPVSVTFMMEY